MNPLLSYLGLLLGTIATLFLFAALSIDQPKTMPVWVTLAVVTFALALLVGAWVFLPILGAAVLCWLQCDPQSQEQS